MAKKIMRASSILAAKGYKASKFDQEGFDKIIGDFFMSHEIKSVITLVPKRFIDMEPKALNENPTEEEIVCFEKERSDIELAKQRCWIDLLDTSIWEKRVNDPNDPFEYTDYVIAMNKGYIKPIIYVDEPFIKNAAYLLSLINEYVVKKEKKGKFLVSLI